MRISLSVEYQLPRPRPPISREPTAFTSSMLPGLTPGMVGSVAGGVEAGAAEAGGAGVGDGAGDCWLVCGLFCPYPIGTRPGANSKLPATINSAGISFLRSILFITTP